jgi:hypothetical protein
MATKPRADLACVILTAMSVFFGWERLRVVYNLILVGTVLPPGFVSGKILHPAFWVFALSEAVGANVCFCAGPVAEGYLCWFGLPRLPVRCALFVIGTMLAVAAAVSEVERWHSLGGFLS